MLKQKLPEFSEGIMFVTYVTNVRIVEEVSSNPSLYSRAC